MVAGEYKIYFGMLKVIVFSHQGFLKIVYPNYSFTYKTTIVQYIKQNPIKKGP
jgi:hypothetical protein